MNWDSKTRIFVAGHKGLVGSAVFRKLKLLGYTNLIFATKSQLDLRDFNALNDFYSETQPEIVIDAAAKVGGIFANDSLSGEFIKDNLLIQTNLIEASRIHGVKKFIFLGSVCIYPKFAEVPVSEDSLLTGPLESTNEAYAVAKISGIYMLRAYRKQYGLNSVSIMPSNIFGPGDNFDKNFGHVIPSLFTKMTSNESEIVLWGDGSPKREFLYSEDLANAIIFLMNLKVTEGLYNVGSGENISISELALLISEIVGYKGKIIWDTSRPNGTPNRPLNSTKILKLGWKPETSIRDGLNQTWKWLKENPNYIKA